MSQQSTQQFETMLNESIVDIKVLVYKLRDVYQKADNRINNHPQLWNSLQDYSKPSVECIRRHLPAVVVVIIAILTLFSIFPAILYFFKQTC